MRIDKFLKVSRILKRRSSAQDAARAGRVAVNGKEAKPAHDLKVGDRVEIRFGEGSVRFEVLKLCEFCRKEEAGSMYRVLGEDER